MAGQTIDPETFRVALKKLIQRIHKCDTATISLHEVRVLARSVANLWFNDVGPLARLVSDNRAGIDSLDAAMTLLLSHTLRATKKKRYSATLNEALRTYGNEVYIDLHKSHGPVLAGASTDSLDNDDVAAALVKLSGSVYVGYKQACKDLTDNARISWRGPANEIREVLRELLEILAPDSEVKKASWFIQNPQTSGPTQVQRARYALEQRAVEKHRSDAAQETVNVLELSISKLVRKTYQSASVGTHTQQDRDEVKRILGYFDVLAKDLLGLS